MRHETLLSEGEFLAREIYKESNVSARLIIAAALIALTAVCEVGVASAQQAPIQETHQAIQTSLKRAIASMTGISADSINLHTSPLMINVRLLNTDYNSGPSSDRENLAASIAALVSRDIANEPSLRGVLALHIEFVKQNAWRATQESWISLNFVETRAGRSKGIKPDADVS